MWKTFTSWQEYVIQDNKNKKEEKRKDRPLKDDYIEVRMT